MNTRLQFGKLPLQQRNKNAMKSDLEPLPLRGAARCASRGQSPLLAEIVWGISHTKNNYLSAHYHRLARRIGRHQSDCGGLPHRGRELLSYDHQAHPVSGARSELL